MRLEVWDGSPGGVELIFYKAAVMEASFMASRERERFVLRDLDTRRVGHRIWLDGGKGFEI